MIDIKTFTFNPFMENTYIISDETNECIIIDPGCYEEVEKDELKDHIESNNLKVVQLLNTHCHIDHVLGNSFVKNTYQVSLEICEIDLEILKVVPSYASSYGFPNYEELLPKSFLKKDMFFSSVMVLF